jgi:hypothetical protein
MVAPIGASLGSGAMDYRWQKVSAVQVALCEVGSPNTATVAAAVNKSGPYMGVPVKYLLTGPLVDEAQDFPSLDDAIQAVEQIIEGRGDRIVGWD